MSSNNDMDWNLYEDIIKDELNVKKFELIDNEGEFVSTKVKLDFKKAGAKFGKQSNSINAWLQSLSETQVQQFMKVGFMVHENINITLEDVQIEKIARDGYASASNGLYTVTLNITLTEELLQEGLARELIRAIQAYRKLLNLPIDLRVDITVSADEKLQAVFENFKHMLEQNLLMRNLLIREEVDGGTEIQIAGHTISLQVIPVNN